MSTFRPFESRSALQAVILGLTLASAPLSAARPGAVAPGAQELVRTVWVMGTSLEVGVRSRDPAAAVAVAEAAIRAVESTEATLSSWRSDSELSHASKAPAGERWSPSPSLATLLDEVEAWRLRTHRAFEPNLGALVDTWGLRDGGRLPSDSAVAAAVEATRIGVLRRVGDELERTDADTWFDAGSFGKGHALRRAAEAGLAVDPTASLAFDFGGQHLAVVPDPSPTPRWLALADPQARERIAVKVRLPRAVMVSVATSGNSERGLRIGGRRIGHLLDPRTGRPAGFDGSVTVIAEDPLVADVLSTALFVLGPDRGRLLLEGLPGVDAVWQSPTHGLVTTLPPDALRFGAETADSRTGHHRSAGPLRGAGRHP